MKPVLLLILASSALGVRLPSYSYGAPPVGVNGGGGYSYGGPSGGSFNGNGNVNGNGNFNGNGNGNVNGNGNFNGNGNGNAYGGGDLQGAASTFDVPEQNPIEVLAANIPGGGVPGEDYPILSSVPDTGFTCTDQQFPGYYADTADETGCQVFHICQFDGRLDSFLCPNGTIFNQQYFVCDWWFNVDCAASVQFVSLNADIGKVPEDNFSGAATNVAPSNGYDYGAPGIQGGAPPLYGTPNRGY